MPPKTISISSSSTFQSSTQLSLQKNIIDFKKKGISILENTKEEDLVEMIKISNDSYYNSFVSNSTSPTNTATALLTDNEYDILKEFMEKKYPKNQILKQIGEQTKKCKAVLPYEMASMNKIKPDTNALLHWKETYKGPYVLSCKLDGVSGLFVKKDGVQKLYTRGDGKIGQDISHFINVLGLDGVKDDEFAIRGEFIIPKKIFEEKYKTLSSHTSTTEFSASATSVTPPRLQNTFANARNLVSGIINSKTIDSKASDIRFVAYEMIYPVYKPSEQLEKIKELKAVAVETVKYIYRRGRVADEGAETLNSGVEDARVTTNHITNESLSELLLEWRANYEYEIDGIIVTDDHIYNRATGNPEHAFAFKMVLSDQMAEAKVVDVIWTPSKNGYLKPRIRIEPIHLNGVIIEYATGFNGKFIEENKIGIGAIVQIIRSGDVIPHIKSVTTPAEKAKMPDVPYKWTDTHVDIILENVGEDITVRIKSATQFFVVLDVEGLSIGNVKRLFEGGYDSVAKIIGMSKDDFEKIEGFKSKMAEKIHTSLHHKLEKASLLDIIVASNKIGRGLGERKIRPILEEIPDIFLASATPPLLQTLASPLSTPEFRVSAASETQLRLQTRLMNIKGIGKENAREFVQNIPLFLAFLKECGLEYKLCSPSPPKNNIIVVSDNQLYKKKIVMTKIRDKEIIDALEKHGATLETTMTKDVFVLIVPSKEDTKTSKTEYAIKNKIPIMTVEDFKVAYL